MYMDFVRFGWIFIFMTPSDVELSFCIVFLGHLCPNSARMMRMYAAFLAAI